MTDQTQTYSTEDYLRALGKELRATRAAVNVLAVIALLGVAAFFLWLIGVIEVQVQVDDGRSLFG